MKVIFAILFIQIILMSSAFCAEEEDGGVLPTYEPEGRVAIPAKEKTLNFLGVYAAQWGIYLVQQGEEIRKHGSIKNWHENALSPRFDRDSFEYNIFKHSLSGNYYYLFYRSRRYTEKDAFLWTFLSSLAFEFTIETTTEKPSYQDMYQTPIFGTVLGIGFEKASDYFFGLETWYGDFLGYVINPMKLIPQFAREDVKASAYIDHKKAGALITFRF